MAGFDGRRMSVTKPFTCHWKEISIALYSVAIKRYGFSSLNGLQKRDGIRGNLSINAVEVDSSKEEKGLTSFAIVHSSGFQAVVYLDVDGRQQNLICEGDDQYQREIESFLSEVLATATNQSFYRGKAFTTQREFLNLDGVSEFDLVLDPATEVALRTNLWSVIEKASECRQLGIPLQRKILLAGPPGSGKTLIAYLTAKKAVKCGNTFIYMPPTNHWRDDDLRELIDDGLRYQPSVLFVEDIDHEQRGDAVFQQILSSMDGFSSKGAKLIMIMTTNDESLIGASLLRPGRTDRIIRLYPPGPKEIKRIIEMSIKNGTQSHPVFDESIDWTIIAEACKGFPSAFVKEVSIGAALTMIDTGATVITEDFLVHSARNLRPQHDRCMEDYAKYQTDRSA